MESQDEEGRMSQHLQNLHQTRMSQHLLVLSREAPPDYSTVCKQKEEEEEEGLPSYSQAVGKEPDLEEGDEG